MMIWTERETVDETLKNKSLRELVFWVYFGDLWIRIKLYLFVLVTPPELTSNRWTTILLKNFLMHSLVYNYCFPVQSVPE